jgi:glyoxylase-like metal-dependent hydrolase (beta-lactamase superfamily II)
MEELIPGVYRLPLGRLQAYAVLDGDGWTLVDCGKAGDGARIREGLAAVAAVPLARAVITHGHPDHYGALAALTAEGGVRAAAHRLDAPYVRGVSPMPEARLTDQERGFFAQATAGVPAAPSAMVDETLEEDDILRVGPGMRVIHTPGHTPGSIALLMTGATAVLFTGDTATSDGSSVILGPFNCDRAQTIASFRRLAELDFDLVCFGHGPPLGGEAGRAAFRRTAAPLHE